MWLALSALAADSPCPSLELTCHSGNGTGFNTQPASLFWGSYGEVLANIRLDSALNVGTDLRKHPETCGAGDLEDPAPSRLVVWAETARRLRRLATATPVGSLGCA